MERENKEIILFLISFSVLFSLLAFVIGFKIDLAIEVSSIVATIASLIIVYRSDIKRLKVYVLKNIARRGVHAILLSILAILALYHATQATETIVTIGTIAKRPTIEFSYGKSSENIGVALTRGNSTFLVNDFALPFSNMNVAGDVVKMTNKGDEPYGIRITIEETNKIDSVQLFEIYLILAEGREFLACSIVNGTLSFNDMPYVVLGRNSTWSVNMVGQRKANLNENVFLSINLRYWDMKRDVYHWLEPIEINAKPIP